MRAADSSRKRKCVNSPVSRNPIHGCGVSHFLRFGSVRAFGSCKLMSQVLENCEDFAVPYLDGIAICSKSWEDHLQHIDEV
ncbi:hypothetical protein CEXT_188871 [Caerostris extrusa]|uniref:Uncharacterized protein n=1 Tax=Caerostris extrusa TaxID=172846 RepID=A0AAV4NMQ1_CAEEX|nr:hypothetical protein CEXT_188871 [Caerostris extrusa]